MPYEVPLHPGPILCPYCGVEAEYVDSSVVYGGCSFGMIYLCSNWPDCDARICAAGEGRPVGTLARQELRDLRKACHHRFDALWQGENPRMNRSEAYQYLHRLMRTFRPEDAHFGAFDEERCQAFLRRWDCPRCRAAAGAGQNYGPNHDGSRGCRNFAVTGHGAIAAGGVVAHCTCDGCF